MQDKKKDKIRKLLALAQSDNPHEAERARVQAQKMMAKLGLSEGEMDVTAVLGKPAPRKSIKDYESLLISAIIEISGCEVSLYSARSAGQWRTQPKFVGLTTDAELAAYSWDVLYAQVEAEQRRLKKDGFLAADVDQYLYGWAMSATKKLVNVFGPRVIPESVKSLHSKETQGLQASKPRSTKISDYRLIDRGLQAGSDAQLNNATHDQRESRVAIGQGK